MAGFAKFLPMPPKSALVTITATKSPITSMYSEIVDGTLKARSTPVTAAERSPAVLGSLKSLHHRYSKPTHAMIETATTMRASRPKKMREAAKAGANAMRTLRMTDCVVSGLTICGAGSSAKGRPGAKAMAIPSL